MLSPGASSRNVLGSLEIPNKPWLAIKSFLPDSSSNTSVMLPCSPTTPGPGSHLQSLLKIKPASTLQGILNGSRRVFLRTSCEVISSPRRYGSPVSESTRRPSGRGGGSTIPSLVPNSEPPPHPHVRRAS